ncbi:bcl-2-related ovarian killer protein isoform X1 [Ursus maritimus]|uniref:Bcl-2-related ovarian killer protein isoform X1 n=1 Tax=Ursus maritimus TaxID=29073 RepID=A0A8M1GQM4_URSMA|nr:bcl-2-related ovarian killer protein isoform X1 [Ursus arctos]XP_040493914.1 bcl-2-related ovarian killer protein isoform X1 [Ursus maritimus]
MEVLRRSSVFAAEIMDAFDRSPTDKELVAQAKALGREFVHARLLRAGLAWSAPERAAPAPGGRLAEVCAVLLRLGDELELIRPSVYRNVARQLNISLQSETVVTDAFLAVASQIFSGGPLLGTLLGSLLSVDLHRPHLPTCDLMSRPRTCALHHMGQGGVPVLGGRGAGRRLCAAGPARHGPRSRRLPWGVCAQDPGTLAAKARWMDRRPQVCGQHGARLPLPLARGRTLQLRPLPEGCFLRAVAGEMSCGLRRRLKPGAPTQKALSPQEHPCPPRPGWEGSDTQSPASVLEALP